MSHTRAVRRYAEAARRKGLQCEHRAAATAGAAGLQVVAGLLLAWSAGKRRATDERAHLQAEVNVSSGQRFALRKPGTSPWPFLHPASGDNDRLVVWVAAQLVAHSRYPGPRAIVRQRGSKLARACQLNGPRGAVEFNPRSRFCLQEDKRRFAAISLQIMIFS